MSVSGIHLMFCVGTHSDFNRVRGSETNLIHMYGHMGRSYLDKAQAAGLYVLYDLKPLIHDRLAGHSPTEQWSIWNSSKNEVRSWINDVKGHPSLYGYYTLDEPNLYGREIPHDLQQNIYNFVKSIDPNHIVALAIVVKDFNLVNFNALDVLIPDYYCFSAGGLSDLVFGTRNLRNHLNSIGFTKPIVFTIQACNINSGGSSWKGHVADQINIVLGQNLATGGIGMWAWGDGIDGGADSDRTLGEVKDAWGASTWTPPPSPPELTPPPERKYRAEPPQKIWKEYTCPEGDIVEITNYDYVGCYESTLGQIICPSLLAPTMQSCPVDGLPVAKGYDIRLISAIERKLEPIEIEKPAEERLLLTPAPPIPIPTPEITLGEVITSPEWWRENWPWLGVGLTGLVLIMMLAKS